MNKQTDRFQALGLSRSASADFIGVGTTTFDRLVREGRMPSPRRIDGRKVWDRQELESAFKNLPHDGANPDAENPWDEVA